MKILSRGLTAACASALDLPGPDGTVSEPVVPGARYVVGAQRRGMVPAFPERVTAR